MPATNARAFTFDWDSTTLVGVKSRGYNMSHDLIDVTTDDDLGWRKLLDDPGLKAVEVTLGMVTDDETVLADLFAVTGKTLQADLPSSLTTPGNLSGTFNLSGLEFSGDSDGAFEISATFMSNGEVTYTASA